MKSLLVHMGVPTKRYLNASLIGAGITYPFFKFKHLHPPTVALFLVMYFRYLSDAMFNIIFRVIGNDSVFNRQAPKHSFQERGATNQPLSADLAFRREVCQELIDLKKGDLAGVIVPGSSFCA